MHEKRSSKEKMEIDHVQRQFAISKKRRRNDPDQLNAHAPL